jgi:hypothetical protein
MRRRGNGLAMAVVLTAALGMTAGPAAADFVPLTGQQDVVAMFSDPADPIGGVDAGLWVGAEQDTAMEIGPRGDGIVGVTVDGDDGSYELDLAAPPGQRLAPGVYTDAQRASFRTAGHPGIEITGEGRGCNDDAGEFEVRDVGYDAGGQVTRLWAVFEQRCEQNQAGALWGEIRVGEPLSAAPIVVPSIVRWPETNLGRPRMTVPVTLFNGSARNLSGVTIGGAQGSDFSIKKSACGDQLNAYTYCQVAVGFAPPVAGTRAATLNFATDQGTATAPLQGWSSGGTTAVHLTGDGGDSVTRGNTYDYSPANADIVVSGTRHEAITQVQADDGQYWYLDMTTPDGTDFAPGQAYNSAQLGEGGDGADRSVPRLSLRQGGHACDVLTGAFTLGDATRWLGDGMMGAYAASFEQHCQNAAPAARGTVQWRAGDTTAPAPWMGAGDVPGPSGAAGGGAGTGAAGGGTASGGTPTAPLSGTSSAQPIAAGRPARGAAPLIKYLGLVGHGHRTLRFSARLPRAGALTVRVTVKLRGAHGKAKTVTLGDGRVSTRRAATKTINIGLRKKVLKALAHVRSAPLTASVTWHPKGAKAIRSHATGVLRLKR